jgi:uncharacterized protein YcbK (DUF882 family)
MITLRELNPKSFPTTKEVDANLLVLLERMNIVRRAFDRPMYVTSGYRSIEDHRRIYIEKAKKLGKTIRIPNSKHLYGQAVDIADVNNTLYNWCLANVHILEQAGLWIEEDQGSWVHFQIVPPKSGNRFFKP